MNKTTLQLASLGTILVGLTAVALWMGLPPADRISAAQQQSVVELLIVAGIVYFAAVFVVLRHTSSRRAVWIVIGVAILLRLGFVFDHPVLSTDVYRYVWDGQVQKAGINPYRYVPNDPALSALRDRDVFPHINRANYAHTIYPPTAEVIFAFVGRITNTVVGMKIAMVAFEILACLCMLNLLAMLELPAERILIYAWNPLAQWSFAYDGHVDAIAIGLMGLALLYRARHRPGLAGAILAGATLVKFLPVVAAPAFVRGERFWRPVLVGALVITLLYALYSGVGAKVFGFIPGYNDEEGLTNGSGIWLLSGLSYLNDQTDWVDLPDDFGKYYLYAAVVCMAVLGGWIARRRLLPGETDVEKLCRDVALLTACALVIISPHFPWYFTLLVLPAVVSPTPSVVWLSMAPVILYLDPERREFGLLGSLIYVPAIAMATLEWRNNRSPKLLPSAIV